MALIHRMGWYGVLAIAIACANAANSAINTTTTAGVAPEPPTASVLARTIIPAPGFRVDGEGAFQLGKTTSVEAREEARPVAEYLVNLLRPMTGLSLPLSGRGDIVLVVEPGHPPGGYDLRVTTSGIWLAADDAAGLFAGVQTLRQLLPPATPATTRWGIAATTISDRPRFAYRGAMLDVARHFFGVDDVKRYIDDIAMLKINVLHLHLADDQGWRIAIDGWPRLTEVGGSSQVGGGAGGYYTQDQYRDIVAYAASRYITIVPEIDMPGHTTAALASYAELNCDGRARPLYRGTSVGFSSLCTTKEVTYQFVTDVITQLAALTPGPWIHIGGDESSSTKMPDYIYFVNRVTGIVAATGKSVIGWHDIGYGTALPPGTVGEYWDYTGPRGGSPVLTQNILSAGGRLIMAPANVAYLDQKYDLGERLGTKWAQAPTTIQEAYQWDPAAIFPTHGEDSILGVEAPLWTETIRTMAEIEYMAFPRIAAIAEIGWSTSPERSFEEFAPRLGVFGAYLDAVGITYKRTPGVPWQ